MKPGSLGSTSRTCLFAAAGSGTLSASPRAGQALPEDMFASPLPAPAFGLGAQSFTGATAGSPKMQSSSPTRFGQPANNGGFGAFAAAQAGGARTEVTHSPGSLSLWSAPGAGVSCESVVGLYETQSACFDAGPIWQHDHQWHQTARAICRSARRWDEDGTKLAAAKHAAPGDQKRPLCRAGGLLGCF